MDFIAALFLLMLKLNFFLISQMFSFISPLSC